MDLAKELDRRNARPQALLLPESWQCEAIEAGCLEVDKE
jgi:hypothetical protein